MRGIARGKDGNVIMAVEMVTERSSFGAGSGLSREDAIVIHCARIDLSPSRRENVRDLLVEGLNWDLLLEKAVWHRLSCLVSYHLKTEDSSKLVPQPVLQKLQHLTHWSLARNMLLQEGLFQLVSALNREEIPVIVLKGAALLGTIYEDISLRPMIDLDILVHPEHLTQAEAIALDQGYTQFWDQDTHDKAIINQRHLPNLINVEKHVLLEIHQHIVDSNEPYYFDLSDFWARARPLKTLGAGALTLAPEDLLIHLSIKFLLDRHYQSNSALGQLCDISEIILHYSDTLDWNLIEKVAEENGITSGLHFVLYACERLLDTQVPVSVLQKLQPQDFNTEMAQLFLLKRVLDTKLWLAHDLVDSNSSYSRGRVFWTIIKRFFSVPEEIPLKRGFQSSNIYLYLRRLMNILPRLGGALLRPKALKQDLLLDRWLHDLCRPSARGYVQKSICKSSTLPKE